jgi:glyoxylase-like metal-dependent hydrolase (beta-lactamase superfamily II)
MDEFHERQRTLPRMIVERSMSPQWLSNTYLVAAAPGGAAFLVDAGGPLGPLFEKAAEHRLDVTHVLLTHHHHDHVAELAAALERWPGAAVLAHPQERVPGTTGEMRPDEEIQVGGLTVRPLHTPGHTADHLAFRLESGAVLVGDHVLGRGTSVVTHPEGDVLAYLASLRRVHDLGPSALYCGHGPELTEDPGAVLDFYRAHRAFRESQLLAAMVRGAGTVDELVADVYAGVPREVWPAAAQSTRATLAKLAADGHVVMDGDRVRLP